MNIPGIIEELRKINVGVRIKNGQVILSGGRNKITNKLLTEIRNNKSGIIEYLKKHGKNAPANENNLQNSSKYFPLTAQQKSIWLASQNPSTAALYHQSSMFLAEGKFNIDAYKYAVEKIVKKHESLRTKFVEFNGEPKQEVLPDVHFSIDYEKLEENRNIIDAYNNFSAINLPLSKPPLLKCLVVKENDSRHYLLFNIHHIISDGWSVNVFFKELLENYSSYSKNGNPSNEFVEINPWFRNYAVEQRKYIESPEGNSILEFWKNKIQRDFSPTLLSSKTDYERLEYQDGSNHNFYLSGKILELVRKYCKLKKVTPYNFYSAVFVLLLKKYTGNGKITFGTPFASRNDVKYADVIGCFINTLPVIVDNISDCTFEEFLNNVVSEITEVFDRQNYPAEEIIENLQLSNTGPGNPLFNIIITYQNYSLNKLTTDELTLSFCETPVKNSQSGLVIRIFEETDRVLINIEYSKKLFSQNFVERIPVHFDTLLNNIIENTKLDVDELDYIPDNEKNELAAVLNNTNTGYPEDKTILYYLNKQFKNQKNKTAVTADGFHLSYDEVNKRSNRLANYLIEELNVIPGDIIGIMTGRNEHLIVGIISILKAGAAYLPINPDYPTARKKLMLEDSGCRIILTDRTFAEENLNYVPILKILNNEKYEEKKLTQDSTVSLSDPAYIIYTSGSTGRPKGVIVEHKNLLRLFFNESRIFNFNENDVWTLFHSYSFDFSVWEIFGALLFGGRLVIVPDETVKDPSEYYNLLVHEKVTILNQTPSAFYRLMPDDQSKLSVKYIILGGESLQPRKLRPWKRSYPGIKIINMYGITETTVHVTYKEISDSEIRTGIANIGKPIPTLGICLLDKDFKIVPAGIPGQICVYGSGLARGYLNRPVLTSEKFTNVDPFGLCYLSGDLGRMLENGDIEYLGRMDNQVQVHGFRIELTEIENALLDIEGIKEAVVIAAGEEDNISINVYHTSEKELTNDLIRKELALRIPSHMIPSNYIKVHSIPLTSNGKINKPELLKLKSAVKKTTAKPANRTEEKIVEAWKETLGNIEISTEDSFFSIGGDSIKALKLVGIINKKLNMNLTIAGLYEKDTIKKLASNAGAKIDENIKKEIHEELKQIDESSAEIIDKNSLSDLVERILPMSDIQRGMIYYSLKNPDSSVYHDQFVYQIYEKDFSPEVFEKSLEMMIHKHPMLRTCFNMFDYSEDVQLIHKNIEPALQYEDLSGMGKDEIEKTVNGYCSSELSLNFDIAKAPPWRIKVFRASSNIILICWSFHHSLLDGWSNASFITELLSAYKSILNNKDYKPELLKSGYEHYIAEQKYVKRSSEFKKFWENELDGYKRIELPKAPAKMNKVSAGEHFVPIDTELVYMLKVLASDLGTDIKTMFFSSYIYCMSMLTYENDVLVGIVANNRPALEDGEKIIGCFLNTIPFRMTIECSNTWKEFITSVADKVKELKKYEALSLFEIVKLIGAPAGDLNPLFDTVFNYIDFNIYEDIYSDFSPENHWISEYAVTGYENTNTPLNFTVSNTLNKPVLKISFNPMVISDEWIERLGNYYARILHLMAENINGEAGHKEILTIDDKNFINEINRTKKDFNSDSTYIGEFKKNLPGNRDNIAVVYNGEKLTYKELDILSGKLSEVIKKIKRKKNEIIALITEPSFNLYVGMISILKTECVIMPVSTKTPRKRVHAMLKDSKAGMVLSSRSSLAKIEVDEKELEDLNINVLLFDNINFNNIELSSNDDHNQTGLNNAAYIVYTSGTTGRPKGIVFEHKSLLNLCKWYNEYYSINGRDRTTKYADINYDANLIEIFPALLQGACIYAIPEELKLDMPRLNKFYENNKISVSWLPTPVFEQFLPENNRSLRVLYTGGDRLKNVLKQSYEIYNNYGPAEDTVCASAYKINFNEESIPIGNPIANNKIYIFKKDGLDQMPPGVAGEICLAGSSLSRGYLNDPVLTSKKFVINRQGERIYRTGDLGRFNKDGNLEFLGRIDRQIKIRGQRLEVEEIESLLLKHPDVKEAVVAVEKNSGSNIIGLHAFIVPAKTEINISRIEDYLISRLPAYMIPSYYVLINNIPLTVTGKIDYKVLEKYVAEQPSTPTEFNGEVEKIIAGIWAEVLNKKIESIDSGKNFFEQGGNSINLIRVQRKINQILGTDIPITELLKNTTLKKLAGYLNKSRIGFTGDASLQIKNKKIDPSGNNPEDIAVIGMACKFPGSDDINSFWNNLVNGVESISFFGDEELKKYGIPPDIINNPSYVKASGVVNDPESFDASFFNYTENEARVMDPQIRLFHECVWSALEDGGYDPENYRGRIGLFAGGSKNNIWENLAGNADVVDPISSSLLSSKDNLATLISYKLNLKGPAINIYTACSTSLVAVHEACKSINTGECEMALCGGVNLSLPFVGGSISGEGSVFSDDGHCRPFCAEGKGTVTGNGAGAVLLKPLKAAIKDGDNIYAVVKKSAINNDGYQKVGFTAPSIEGQSELLKSIYSNNGIDREGIGYIETHGTGTELGDVVEIEALKSIFGNSGNKIALGSVKSNIGHLDTAAGIASFIKTVLVLNKKTFVQSLHFTASNKKIDFDNSPFYVVNKTSAWEQSKDKRKAGISAFGIGGTNAHVVLEEYLIPEMRVCAGEDLHIVPFSAKTPSALTAYKNVLKKYLEENKDSNPGDVAFTLQTARKPFQFRSAVVYKDISELIKKLEDDSSYNKINGRTNLIFMFPGQGTQYINMGRQLYDSQPEFKLWFDKCNEIIKHYGNLDIKKILYPDHDLNCRKEISETVESHCTLFVFEYSLAKLMIGWGVKPSAMIGHSLGEYTAACLSGIISLEDAIKIVVTRGRLAKKVPGRMLSVVTEESKLRFCVNEFNKIKDRISIAAINSDRHFILSGGEISVSEFKKYLESENIEARILYINFASHCGLMNSIVEEFNDVLEGIIYEDPLLPVVANLDCRILGKGEVLTGSYWTEHLLNPVKFAKGLSTLISGNSRSTLIEIGPGSTLSTFAKNISAIKGKYNAVSFIPHPKEDADFNNYFYNRIAAVWRSGVAIDWKKFNRNNNLRKLSLPTYCFDKINYQVPKQTPIKDILKTKKTDNWFYIPQWKQSDIAGRQRPVNKNILIFTDDFGLAESLIPLLSGNEIRIVKKDDEFKHPDENTYKINIFNESDYMKLFAELKNRNFIPDNILFMTGLEENMNSLSYEKIIDEQSNGFLGLTYISKAASANLIDRLQITVVANNLTNVSGDEKVNPGMSAVLAAVKVIPQEYYGFKAHCIEFEWSDLLRRSKYYSEKILNEIYAFTSGNSRDIVVYRNKKRWIISYDNIEIKEDDYSISRFKNGGVYLITGGAGNVGAVIALYLAEKYNARLLITGKTQLPAKDLWKSYAITSDDYSKKIIGNLLECEKKGGHVTYFASDVSNKESMEKIFEYASGEYGSIDGVFHAAAATKDKSISAPLNEITLEELQKQLDVKVKGMINISEMVKRYRTGFVMVTSSTSSILGGIGFGCYAASNVIVNSFVREENKEGKTEWLSLIMDGWYFPEYSNTMKEAPRVSTIKREEGGNIISRLNYAYETDQIIISKRDINKEIEKWTSGIYKRENKSNHKNAAWVKERPFLTTNYKQPVNVIQKKLCEIWEEFFGISGIGTDDHFYELGGDSLKATSVVSIIHKRLGIKIPLSEFLKKPTIEGLSRSVEKLKNEEYYEIQPAPDGEAYPLSSAQKRLFMIYRMEKDSLAYNIHSAALLEGELDLTRLQNSFSELVRRHESLRTVFRLEKGKPVQRIIDFNNIEFNIETVEHEDKFFRPFDLEEAPLIRAGIKTVDKNKNVLLIDTHHIISDAISMSICFKELSWLYNGIKLPDLAIQYKDYAVWQIDSLSKDTIIKQKEFWKESFSGELPVLNLPYDFKRPSVQKYDGDILTLEIENTLLSSLRNIAKESEATMFMLLLSAFNILLSKYTGQEDVIVGTPSAGRKNNELKNVIGMFANTLALRNKPAGGLSFRDFLNIVKDNSVKAFENQDYQFEELVEELKVERDVSRNPLFDVMFVYINIDFSHSAMREVKIKPYELKNDISRFDLTLHCSEEKNKITLTFEYSSLLFRRETIIRMSEKFKSVLEAISGKSDIMIKNISLIDNDEVKLLLRYNNTRKKSNEKQLTVNHLYETQCKIKSDRAGITFVEESKSEIKYFEFDRNVNKLAYKILSSGENKKGGLIGVACERNEFMITAVMAVLKSGNGYVPIDPYSPVKRAKYIIGDSGCSSILCESKFIEFTKEVYDGEIITIEETLEQNIDPVKITFPFVNERDPLFLLYTSGSTGRPKGVLMPHKPIINLILWLREEYPVDNEKILFLNPFTFDMSVWGLYGWAVNGTSVCVLKHGDEKDPEKIAKAIKEKSITTIHLVPSMLAMLLEYLKENPFDTKVVKLRYIFVAGEALNKNLIEKFNKSFKGSKVELVNLYGPTEAHVVTHFRTKDLDDKNHITVPIGKPITNTKVFIVDKEMKIVPQGIVGEILLGGDCLAGGYVNKTSLTDEKFIFLENELTEGKERFYRTGDLGRWLSDGNIEFLGRNDFQVKIRGFRVEPDEIQSNINKIKGVKDSLVLVKETASGDKRLVAYTVYEDKVKIDESFIRNELKKNVADYMIPSIIMGLEKFPLNPNGKVDRKYLPEPELSEERKDVVTPRNKLEKRIAEIWSEVLNVKNISIRDNFFDLGGHSLLIIRVHNELEKEVDKKIEVVDLFRYPTIASLSEYLKAGKEDNTIIDNAAIRAENQKKARRRRSVNPGRKGGSNE